MANPKSRHCSKQRLLNWKQEHPTYCQQSNVMQQAWYRQPTCWVIATQQSAFVRYHVLNLDISLAPALKLGVSVGGGLFWRTDYLSSRAVLRAVEQGGLEATIGGAVDGARWSQDDAKVMLRLNLDVADGLSNEARAICTACPWWMMGSRRRSGSS